jgi:hypothetical protein
MHLATQELSVDKHSFTLLETPFSDASNMQFPFPEQSLRHLIFLWVACCGGNAIKEAINIHKVFACPASPKY